MIRNHLLVILAVTCALGVVVACGDSDSNVVASAPDSGAAETGSNASDAAPVGDGDASTDAQGSDAKASTDADAGFDAGFCGFNLDPNDMGDHDADGQSVAQGDCNDCDDTLGVGRGCP